jgi:cell division inhibitor SulA
MAGERLPINMAIEQTRNLSQNALLHAICADVAKQKQWAGQWLDCEGWKRLFSDCWCREAGLSPGKVVPSLDGESVVVLNISTRKLKKAQMAELITWIYAYCDTNGIKLRVPEYYELYPEAQS